MAANDARHISTAGRYYSFADAVYTSIISSVMIGHTICTTIRNDLSASGYGDGTSKKHRIRGALNGPHSGRCAKLGGRRGFVLSRLLIFTGYAFRRNPAGHW